MTDAKNCVSKEFCEERHRNIEEIVHGIEKELSNIKWVIITGLGGMFIDHMFGSTLAAKASEIFASLRNIG